MAIIIFICKETIIELEEKRDALEKENKTIKEENEQLQQSSKVSFYYYSI